jgi:hypothetical protein
MTARKSALIPALALIAATVLAGAPAHAHAWQPKVVVAYTFDPEASTAWNYNHIQHVAKRACRAPGPEMPAALAKRLACTADLVDRLVAATRLAELAQLHFTETGRGSDAVQMLASRGD